MMSGLPQDLVFAVLFGAVLLFQLLRRHLRRRASPPAAEARTTPETDVPAVPAVPDATRAMEAMEALRRMAGPPLPLRTPAPAPAPAPATYRATERPLADAAAAPDRRRFSRSALLGHRRSQQDAIVIAAILQPCRAHRPYEAD
jgi:hypothetical protein